MYKAVIPAVQGIAYAATRAPNPSPLEIVSGTYGAWNDAMAVDPTGSLLRDAAEGAVVSAAILGVLGAMLPFFSATEGVKWGALIGASRGVYLSLQKQGKL